MLCTLTTWNTDDAAVLEEHYEVTAAGFLSVISVFNSVVSVCVMILNASRKTLSKATKST